MLKALTDEMSVSAFLCIGIQLVLAPTNGVFFDVLEMIAIILIIADNVVVESALPNVFTISLVAKTFKGRYKLRHRSMLFCRGRRPLQFVTTLVCGGRCKSSRNRHRRYYTKTPTTALLCALSVDRPSVYSPFSAACIASRKTSREERPALPLTAKYGLLPALIITRPGRAADKREPRSRSRVRW